MLTSLIAVLVLLVIGFYAGTIAVVGRAAIGEAQLSRSRRLALGLAGVSALALAYVIYSHPLGSKDPLNPPSPWVSQPAPTTESASAVATADTAAPAADPVATETPAAESPPAAPVAAPELAASEPRSIPPSAETEPDSSLSASAAALEAAMRRRRQALPALLAEPVETVPSPAPGLPAPASAAPPRAPKVVDTPAPRRQAGAPATPAVAVATPPRRASAAVRAPLTIVVHNQLGAAQQSERLALLIEGKRVASFEITEAAPSIVLPIHLPRPGLLHYRIEGESLQGRRLGLQGEGCIRVVDGARFQVRRRDSDSRQVFLETVNG